MTGAAHSGDRGHRNVPHTADTRIEAWAPTREACLTEAVAALVASFADTANARPTWTVTADVAADTDEDALVAVLDEVIYVLDTQGGVPVQVEFAPGHGGLGVRLHLVAVDEVDVIGAVPKAVTLHELRFERSEAGWACAVTIDV